MTGAFDLIGRRAVVTGGAGRLGRAIAKALSEAGADVVLAGRDADALAEAASGLSASIQVLDLVDEASISTAFDEIEADGGPAAILVNNAGVASAARFGEVDAAEFDRVLRVNVTGAYLCAQRAAPAMRELGGGKIINLGSIYGTVAADQRLYDDAGDMVRSSSPYAASKAALVNLTRDLAVRLAEWNVQVNMVSPGGVEADQPSSFQERYRLRTPAGRMATPADIGPTAVFLASAASDYVTGQNIHVDGGFTAW
jgi:NAD(P)-dependent dehydrogenase (short-subunit alcohol dehydrogenase family)